MINRRNFLDLMLHLTIGLIISQIRTINLVDKKQQLSFKLVNIFKHKMSSRVLGNEYLQSSSNRINLEELLWEICNHFDIEYESLLKMNNTQLKENIKRLQKRDFEQGKIIQVRGWVLSKTEILLCNLATFI